MFCGKHNYPCPNTYVNSVSSCSFSCGTVHVHRQSRYTRKGKGVGSYYTYTSFSSLQTK